MIKLNNKNITYVALADSNNSLKAPKEIWYADSNNSVKLVYRRKDALIEGEDYEKYHWLNGDGSAYINTLHSASEDLDWATKVADLTDGKALFWDRDGDGYAANMNVMIARTNDYRIGVRIANNSNEILLNPFPSSFTVQTNGASITIDGQSYSIIKNAGFNRNIKLFQTLSFADTNGVKCAYFHFIDANGIIIQNIIPCKLLKPVPKWLDANGIRRNIGECGMIDLVSGKFYGNVNSVGAFTVENYYERKEWLVGDGSAYIDTDIIVDVPTLHYNLETVLNTASALCGSRNANGSNSSSVSVFTPTRLRLDIFDTTTYADFSGGVIDVDVPNKVITINDVPFTTTRTNFGNADYSFRIFDLYHRGNYNDVPRGTMKIHHFSITDNSHNLSLIPCTLTMDLPASMDANNIARTKGTSGMWDLVSDKFYGNVASSGTFKAVNLAEGVDYEVHQWLKVSVSTRVDMAALPVDSTNLYFKHKHISGINYHYFRTTGEEVDYDYYYATDVFRCAIWNISNRTQVYKTHIIEDEIVINCNSSNRYVNGYDIPIYGSTIKQVSIISKDQSGFEGLISPITIDGIERYIPVKLLRSIPSTYDANGIARQAGECGMYDTVNDVFYGNVASSGSFTVSDDS